MPSNPLFERTVAALLAGDIICEYRYEDLYTYLLATDNQQRVTDLLDQLNRSLRRTQSNDAWVCAYSDLSSPDAKDAIRQQFRDVANHFEALVQFLRLVMNIEARDRPIAPGEHLSEGKVIDRIANVPTLEKKLISMTEKKMFLSRSRDVAGMVRAVMDAMVKKGYLIRFGSSGAVYQATGKFSWLYDMMAFIQTHEGIQADDVDEDAQLRLT